MQSLKQTRRPCRIAMVDGLERRILWSAVSATSLVSSAGSIVSGQTVTFTATVTSKSGKPTGNVVFKTGSTTLGTAVINSSGKAVFSSHALPVGTDNLTAAYTGSSAFAGSSSTAIKEIVSRDASNVSLVSSIVSGSVFGQGVTFKAVVTAKSPGSGVPAGSITFTVGSTKLGTVSLNSAGGAILTTSTLGVGADKITATFGGSTSFNTSTATITQNVSADTTKTTLALSGSSVILSDALTLTAAVTAVTPGIGEPAGSVEFYDGSTALGSAVLDKTGHASFSSDLLALGTHHFTAHYNGSASAKASLSSSATAAITLPGMTSASDGLQSGAVVAGSGVSAQPGDVLTVNYLGYLTNGTVFDTSLQSGRTPLQLTLGTGQVIAGWDQGLIGTKAGERLVLVIPPALGYGSTAQSGIPANSTLIFVVQVLSIQTPVLAVKGGSAQTVAITDNESPAATDGTIFSAAVVGKSTTSTFAISNSGAGILSLTGSPMVQLTGAGAASFSVGTLTQSGNSILFTITFNPKSRGLRSAKVTIPTNDPASPFSFTIEGTGE